jgi:hypothetical protein
VRSYFQDLLVPVLYNAQSPATPLPLQLIHTTASFLPFEQVHVRSHGTKILSDFGDGLIVIDFKGSR